MQGILRFLPLCLMLLFSMGNTLFAQQQKEPQDSLVRLIEASSAQLMEIDSVSYRKVTGPARFLHNNTYLLCDTALWNVATNIIDAIGNVQIIQENTFLTSDKIIYIVDENLAQFRGSLVELFDKEGNVLRTKNLDYNTKDSIAIFYGGGAMRNADGNLIEGRNGEYRSADKIFSFKGNVQMFTDSVFIKTTRVDYNTESNKAFFGRGTTAWQEDNMLFANDGEFDRPQDIFHFNKDSYILTKNQEIWADTLSYFRLTGVAELYRNIQILDTTQRAYCFADEAVYTPEPFKAELTRKPSVAMYTLDNGVRDTVFLAADTIKYYTIPYCNIDSLIVVQAAERKKLSKLDPLITIEEQAEKIRNLSEEAMDNPFINMPKRKEENKDSIAAEGMALPDGGNKVSVAGIGDGPVNIAGKEGAAVAQANSLAVNPSDSSNIAVGDSLGAAPPDSLGAALPDSLGITADSVNVVKDTTAITFIDAWRNVKVYRSDVQALCDSLIYTGVDSIARLYVNPVMWNNGKHQFTSDSMQLVIENNVLSKANLITNAFMASQEDTVHYNQIKGTEMVAYFKDNDIYRYDALGGASMIFYLQEDSIITIMNRKEGKILSARIKERQIQRIKYVENLKNDALPVYNLTLEEQRLKGFNWRGAERPQTRSEVTDRKIKESRSEHFRNVRFPDYPFTEIYFADTREAILKYKATSDSLRLAAELARNRSDFHEQQMEQAYGREDELLKQHDSLDDSTKDVVSGLKERTGIELKRNLSAIGDDIDYRALIDSLTLKLLPKKQISELTKQERKIVKREQAAIKKEIKRARKQYAKLLKKQKRERRKASR